MKKYSLKRKLGEKGECKADHPRESDGGGVLL